MHVAVTGATGFVGRHLVETLLANGHEVRALCRSWPATGAIPTGAEVRVVGTISGNTVWGDSLARVDGIVHLAARVHVLEERARAPLEAYREVNVDGTAQLARAAVAAGVRRIVFVSSIKVNGEATTGAPFSDSSPAAPTDPYGVSKLEAEQALRQIAAETGLEVVILRPPLVYGPGVKANFERLLAGVDRGFPFPFGAVHNRRSLIYVGNFVDAVLRSLEHPAAPGETFLVSDGEPVSSAQLVAAIGRSLGRRARLLGVPPRLIEVAGLLLRREAVVQRLLGSLEVDSSRFRERLDWKPPYTMEAGLTETARWWRAAHD